jgi:hypothetical protein
VIFQFKTGVILKWGYDQTAKNIPILFSVARTKPAKIVSYYFWWM